MSNVRRVGRPLGVGLVAGVLLAGGAAAPPATAAPQPAASDVTATSTGHPAPKKPARTRLGKGDSRVKLDVKFAQGQPVRLQDGRLRSTALSADLMSQVNAVLDPSTVTQVERLFHTASENAVRQLAADATRRSGRAQPDLNQWYRVQLRAGVSMASVVDRLNALAAVEIARPAPVSAPPPSVGSRARSLVAATPDFTGRQGYAAPAADGGIDATYAKTVPGGTGTGVTVDDIEFGWLTEHEDLTQLVAPDVLIPNGSPTYSWQDHGTAVVGEIAGDANAFGVTGLTPGVQMRITNVSNVERGYDPANAVLAATQALSPGDVILLEQQAYGPVECQQQYVPVEWIPAVYDAIVQATSKGIHVVEAAGNGNVSLDSSCFGAPFPSGQPDSGAIIVGAGASTLCGRTPRTRMSFSTYGTRVNVHGWGECVTSSGYGDLQGSTLKDQYTARFSGTSSASPIVTSAVAALSGVAKSRGATLAPAQLRQLLVDTGTGQVNPGGGTIGPLPNLRAAIATLGGGQNQAPTAAFSTVVDGLAVQFRDQSSDPDGTVASRTWQFGDGSTSTDPNPTHTYPADGTYPVSLKVVDNQGLVSAEVQQTVTVSARTGDPNVLVNGRTVTGISGAAASERRWTITVPPGATGLEFLLAGGTGDADLYVRRGSAPTLSVFDCRPWVTGNGETCTMPDGQPGTYHVMVRGYQSYASTTLTARYTAAMAR